MRTFMVEKYNDKNAIMFLERALKASQYKNGFLCSWFDSLSLDVLEFCILIVQEN